MAKHIFVAGDLIIDHAVFVRDPTTPNQPAPSERVYKALRRQDAAGGAANTARLLAGLSDGATYLWGVFGSSPWGTFRRILRQSQNLDGSTGDLELRGVRDETDSPMNTITRLVRVEEQGGKHVRVLRYDDLDHIHVPEERKLQSVLYHLRAIHSKKHHEPRRDHRRLFELSVSGCS